MEGNTDALHVFILIHNHCRTSKCTEAVLQLLIKALDIFWVSPLDRLAGMTIVGSGLFGWSLPGPHLVKDFMLHGLAICLLNVRFLHFKRL